MLGAYAFYRFVIAGFKKAMEIGIHGREVKRQHRVCVLMQHQQHGISVNALLHSRRRTEDKQIREGLVPIYILGGIKGGEGVFLLKIERTEKKIGGGVRSFGALNHAPNHGGRKKKNKVCKGGEGKGRSQAKNSLYQ